MSVAKRPALLRAVLLRAVLTGVAARALFEGLDDAMPTRRNYRHHTVGLAAGPALAIAAIGAVVADDGIGPRVRAAAAFAGVTGAAAGALDDHRGSGAVRGLRGHLKALRQGQLTTGAIKLGAIGVAGMWAGWRVAEGNVFRRAAAGAVVASSANLLNLLDLRPGRALKAGLVVATPLALRDGPGRDVAVAAVGAAAGLLPADLTERAMLGDTGANCLGALLGVALVAGASTRRIVASLAVLAGLTAASEVVSFSDVIDATPSLRWFDRLGRKHTDA